MFKSKKTLSNIELFTFCEQLALLLKAGISTYEGLLLIQEDIDNAYSSKILQQLITECDNGAMLSEALKNTDVFPPYMINMVQIGELSGKLDDVLSSLSLYYQREESIVTSIKHAVLYPFIMILMMIVVVVVLVVNVLPIFNDVFIQLGSELSGFAKSALGLGEVLGKFGIFVFTGVVIIGAAIYIYGKSNNGKKAITLFQAKFFITKNFSYKVAIGRFANGMSLMLSSGLDIDQSLEKVAQLIDNPIVKEKILLCQTNIENGMSFADAISKSSIFSGINARLLYVGFKTGAVDTIMQSVAERHEIEVDEKLTSLIAIIEPSLVAFLSVVVGFILLSVMLPLVNIISTIG